jgi:thiol-disulfide isomerase/thioredoxin
MRCFLVIIVYTYTMKIKYYGAEWCGPCKKVKPQVKQLCTKYVIDLEEYDYDSLESEESATILKLPTIQIWDRDILQKEITTNHVSVMEEWLKIHVRVIPTDDF